jgi:hypothetical protein
MKSQNIVANAESVLTGGDQPGEAEQERSKSAPTLQQIRERAFEIHIERGGFHGMDLDDWMQAERELQEKYKNNDREARAKKK